jgi:hypothetical protein
MRLTSEWGARKEELQLALEDASHPERLEDNSRHHFCIFSDNVLAVSVVVRSTIEVRPRPWLDLHRIQKGDLAVNGDYLPTRRINFGF